MEKYGKFHHDNVIETVQYIGWQIIPQMVFWG